MLKAEAKTRALISVKWLVLVAVLVDCRCGQVISISLLADPVSCLGSVLLLLLLPLWHFADVKRFFLWVLERSA